MNNNNTVANSAIAQINNERVQAVQAAARLIILNIENAQRNITAWKKSMVPYQDRVNALRSVTYTQAQVLGSALPTSPNANEAAIAAIIEMMNGDRVKLVEEQAKIDLSQINSILNSIANEEKNIANYRKQLSELTVTEVSTDILG